MSETTTLTNQEIMSLFQQGVAEELASQPLYYSASKKVRNLRRMLREHMQDIQETREELQKAHVEGHTADTMEGEQFVPETEDVVVSGEQRSKLIFKSEEDREKFNDKWDDLLEEGVEGFPVIQESSLEKVEDDIRIPGNVLDILFEFDLISEE